MSNINPMAVTPATQIQLEQNDVFVNIPVSGNQGSIQLISGNCYVATSQTQPLDITDLTQFTLFASVGTTIGITLEASELLWVLVKNPSGCTLQTAFFNTDSVTNVDEAIAEAIAPLKTDIEDLIATTITQGTDIALLQSTTADIVVTQNNQGEEIILLQGQASNLASDGNSFIAAMGVPTALLGGEAINLNQLNAAIAGITVGIIWQESVATFADLATTYPTPALGWAALVQDVAKNYIWNGVAWVTFNATTVPPASATQAGTMSSADFITVRDIAQIAFNAAHPIGEEYLQSNTGIDPNILYNQNGVVSVWEQVATAGESIRFQGGNALAFGSAMQPWAMPRISFSLVAYSNGDIGPLTSQTSIVAINTSTPSLTSTQKITIDNLAGDLPKITGLVTSSIIDTQAAFTISHTTQSPSYGLWQDNFTWRRWVRVS